MLTFKSTKSDKTLYILIYGDGKLNEVCDLDLADKNSNLFAKHYLVVGTKNVNFTRHSKMCPPDFCILNNMFVTLNLQTGILMLFKTHPLVLGNNNAKYK